MNKNSFELPHDLLAEKSLLGCLIIDSASIDEISDLKISKDDFYNPRYGMIYDAIFNLSSSNKAIDYVTVCSQLTNQGLLESAGGEQGVLEVVEDQASSANVRHYSESVKEKSSLRELVRVSMRISESGKSYKGDTEEFFQEVERSIFKLTSEAKGNSLEKLSTYIKMNLEELEDTSRKPGEIQGIPTGYEKLDALTLGLQPGQLVILASRPGMGKTSLALNIAINACDHTGLPVVVFSLEMLGEELSKRLLTSMSKVDSKKLRTKNFNDTDLRKIGASAQELAKMPILIGDSGTESIFDIQSKCRKIKAEQGLGLVVIDYLQLMSTTKSLPREQQISEISRGLKIMAKELDCPVIALSQLNRSVEARPNKRPNTSDLRESGAIEQDADIVTFIYRDEFYNPDTKEPGIAEIIVGKNRSGSTGVAKLAWIGAYTSFENLTMREQ